MSVGKLIREGLSFANVVSNGIASAGITPGRTIERIVLQLGGGLAKANIPLIRIKANGKTFFEGTASQIDKLNKYRGIYDTAAFLTLDFTEITGRDRLDQMVGAFDTSQGIANITIEVTTATAAGSPTLNMFLVESGAQAASYSPIMAKTLRYPYATSVGGTLPIVLPFGKDTGAVIKRVFFESANMTGLVVKQSGNVIHESNRDVNEFMQREHGRVPQAGMYCADFIMDGNNGNALDTRDARSMEWLMRLSAADNGHVIVEYYDTLGNL